MEGHLKIPVLLLVAGLTLSCTAEEEAPVPDSGNNKEASVPGCGENKVHASADCTSRCAAPCRCITVMSSPGMSNFPKACLRSCKEPWDCPGTERCGYYDGALVCVPEYLSVPKGTYHVSANVDCFSSPGRTYDGCRGKDLVQTQTFGFKGLFKGAMCTSMLQRRCPGMDPLELKQEFGDRLSGLDQLVFHHQQSLDHTGCQCGDSHGCRPWFDPAGRLKERRALPPYGGMCGVHGNHRDSPWWEHQIP